MVERETVGGRERSQIQIKVRIYRRKNEDGDGRTDKGGGREN